MCASQYLQTARMLGMVWSKYLRMTEWRSANAGCLAAVRLDMRDLGGHSDVTQRAFADPLGTKVK